MQLRIEHVDPRDIELLEVNARYMRHETFQRLVSNVRDDGVLTSVPFCVRGTAKPWRVLSGNHRVKASIAAGLSTIAILVTDEELSEGKQRAIQLSHNAIAGEDDHAILKEIYEGIKNLDLKAYAGLDDKTLELLEKVKTDPLSTPGLEWTQVTFTFLPDEAERLREVLTLAAELAKGEAFAARMKDYDRFMDAISKVAVSKKVKNSATALGFILDDFEARHAALDAKGDLTVGECSQGRSEGGDASQTAGGDPAPQGESELCAHR